MIKRRLYHAAVLIVILLGAGTFYYSYAEGWSYVDSFYFSTMTLTTIGYGDLAPTNPGSKIFTSVYALFGIGIMLYILSSVIGIFILKQERFFGKIFLPLHKIMHHENEIKKEKKINIKQEREIRTHDKVIRKQEREIDKLKREIKKKK
jgi:voltage-gated potassium channel Kch